MEDKTLSDLVGLNITEDEFSSVSKITQEPLSQLRSNDIYNVIVALRNIRFVFPCEACIEFFDVFTCEICGMQLCRTHRLCNHKSMKVAPDFRFALRNTILRIRNSLFTFVLDHRFPEEIVCNFKCDKEDPSAAECRDLIATANSAEYFTSADQYVDLTPQGVIILVLSVNMQEKFILGVDFNIC